MKHTKGIFIDSSYRRSGLLKTLLHGLRHEQGGEKTSDEPYEGHGQVYSSASAWRNGLESGKTQIKNVASL